MAKKKSPKKNYIDNEKLTAEFRRYKKFVDEWKAAGNTGPAPLEDFPYIGESFIKIAEGFVSQAHWQRSVVPRDDLVSMIVRDMVLYSHNIDPEYGNGPFGYLTRIAHTACIRAFHGKLKYDKGVKAGYDKNVAEMTLELAEKGFPVSSVDELAESMRYDGVDNEDDQW